MSWYDSGRFCRTTFLEVLEDCIDEMVDFQFEEIENYFIKEKIKTAKKLKNAWYVLLNNTNGCSHLYYKLEKKIWWIFKGVGIMNIPRYKVREHKKDKDTWERKVSNLNKKIKENKRLIKSLGPNNPILKSELYITNSNLKKELKGLRKSK